MKQILLEVFLRQKKEDLPQGTPAFTLEAVLSCSELADFLVPKDMVLATPPSRKALLGWWIWAERNLSWSTGRKRCGALSCGRYIYTAEDKSTFVMLC